MSRLRYTCPCQARKRPRPRLLTQTAIEGLQAIAAAIFFGLAFMGLALLDL